MGWGKYMQLSEEEARRRLLAWDVDGQKFADAKSHNATGGTCVCSLASLKFRYSRDVLLFNDSTLMLFVNYFLARATPQEVRTDQC